MVLLNDDGDWPAWGYTQVYWQSIRPLSFFPSRLYHPRAHHVEYSSGFYLGYFWGSGLPTGIIEDLGAGIEFSHDMLTLHEPLVFAMRLVAANRITAGRSAQDMRPCHLRVVKLAVPWRPRTSNLTGAALKYVVGYIDLTDGYISGQEPQSCICINPLSAHQAASPCVSSNLVRLFLSDSSNELLPTSGGAYPELMGTGPLWIQFRPGRYTIALKCRSFPRPSTLKYRSFINWRLDHHYYEVINLICIMGSEARPCYNHGAESDWCLYCPPPVTVTVTVTTTTTATNDAAATCSCTANSYPSFLPPPPPSSPFNILICVHLHKQLSLYLRLFNLCPFNFINDCIFCDIFPHLYHFPVIQCDFRANIFPHSRIAFFELHRIAQLSYLSRSYFYTLD
ncbi:uncharacterized protein H6S33_012229 [Morchella sextelata]|uniref:uncharacterized protein n=1 Tax=Morchella sextelata TaxID=1174677 RepID=UPI001D03D3CC|nr:uncharacterized protein H6S33_012229 [Morchella sextelata]KAH0610702.1 hypothetical protein H6S33_012229 [Morchella sextelata]